MLDAESAPSIDRPDSAESRRPCPAPANLLAEVEAYDRSAHVATFDGPRYRMTYRVLGEGPPLILLPGIASTYRGYCLTLNRLASRFRTIIYDYPGDRAGDGATLNRITHADLIDDVHGLIEHLNLGRVFLVGVSFGSTVALGALHREPRRFPRAVLQGAFAHRTFTAAERLGLALGRRIPGPSSRLPLRERILTYNNKPEFPRVIEDRWPFYLEQNGLTPIRALAHRVSLLTNLDLRPILAQIPVELLLLQGREDRVVPRRDYDELLAGLPRAQGVVMPLIGHQPHYTHGEVFAQAIDQFLLPCAPTGCPNESKG